MTTRTTAAGGQVAQILDALEPGAAPEESFRRLFELYHRPVHRFFARRGLSPEDCQDLTQETFLGVYRGMGSFRPGEPFEAWLFTIAANAYRKRLRHRGALRRQGREVPLGGDERGGDPPSPGPEASLRQEGGGPLAETLGQERSRLLRQAVARMPEQMRSCLILRVYHDLKYREVAAILRLSVDTVKAHLFQARQRLKAELGDYFGRVGWQEDEA